MVLLICLRLCGKFAFIAFISEKSEYIHLYFSFCTHVQSLLAYSDFSRPTHIFFLTGCCSEALCFIALLTVYSYNGMTPNHLGVSGWLAGWLGWAGLCRESRLLYEHKFTLESVSTLGLNPSIRYLVPSRDSASKAWKACMDLILGRGDAPTGFSGCSVPALQS